MKNLFGTFLLAVLAVSFGAPAIAATMADETPTCKAFYEKTIEKDYQACKHVSIAIEWTSPTFAVPEPCNTWEKFVASGSKSSDNYRKCDNLCPETMSAIRQPPNCPRLRP